MPPVVVAGLLTAVLWLLTGQAADWVHANATYVVHSAVVRTVLPHPTGLVLGGEPLTGSAVLTAALAGAVAAFGTFLAVRRLPLWTGRWAAFLAVWFTVVAAAVGAGTARSFSGMTLPWTAERTSGLLAALVDGYWGLVNGWVVGLAVVVTLALTDRRDDPAGTRHARALPHVRILPAVLTAVVTAVAVWAGAGVTQQVLLSAPWAGDVLGPLAGRVVPPAMRWGETPQDLLDQPVELGLLAVVALVVGVLAALATRRLPPATGRVALGLAVWFACVAAAATAALVREVAHRLEVFGSLSGPDLNQVLPPVQDALAWGIGLGWLVALLTVLVHRHAGTVVPQTGPVEDPWPAPAPTPEPVDDLEVREPEEQVEQARRDERAHRDDPARHDGAGAGQGARPVTDRTPA